MTTTRFSLLVGLLLGLIGSRSSLAASGSQLEVAVTEYLAVTRDAARPLYRADRLEMVQALADEIAVLAPVAFNDLLGHLLADYQQTPGDRPGLDGLFGALETGLQPEFKARRDRIALIVVIDDVFAAWSVASVFAFGRGVWISRGSGLETIPKFRLLVRNIVLSTPRSLRARLAVLGLGGGAAAVQLLYRALATTRQDPAPALAAVQAELVAGLTKRVELLSRNADPASLEAELRYLLEAAPAETLAIRRLLGSLSDRALENR